MAAGLCQAGSHVDTFGSPGAIMNKTVFIVGSTVQRGLEHCAVTASSSPRCYTACSPEKSQKPRQ